MLKFIANLFKKKEAPKRHQPIPNPRSSAVVKQVTHNSPTPQLPEPDWFSGGAIFNDIAPISPSSSIAKISLSKQMRENLREYVKEAMPEPCASLKIYHELNSREHTTSEMAKLIGSDPLLAAKILKTANSVAYSFVSEVTYVGRAITLLGTNEIKAIILAESIRMSTKGFKGNSKFVETVRSHSAMVASVSQSLANNITGLNKFEVATIGLLHDMGKILYDIILKSGKKINTNRDIPQLVIEAIVASVFAELWGLSSKISQALEFIPYPLFYDKTDVEDEIVPLITTVAVANFIANATGFSDEDPLYNIKEEYLLATGLSRDPERWLNREIVADIEKNRLTLS